MHAPALLQQVTLVANGDHGTQVLDVESEGGGATLVLARLAHHRDADTAPDVIVVWTGDTGRYACPVEVRRAQRDYGPVWLARITGPPVRRQRRSHFRAPMHVPVAMTWTAEDGEDITTHELTAVAADLSEGGLLATVRAAAPPTGARVSLTLRIDDDVLELDAMVVRHTTYDGGGRGVALEFTDPGRHGDRLRRAAFEAERRIAVSRRQ